MSYLDESYLTETLTEKQLYELTYNKSKSLDSMCNLRASLNTFQYFTQDEFQRDKEQVLKDLIKIYKENRDTKSILILLQKFKDWLGEDHDNITTKCGQGGTKKKKAVSGITKKFYLEGVKKWIRLCGNIKIDNLNVTLLFSKYDLLQNMAKAFFERRFCIWGSRKGYWR
jgi:hypothetical protein